MALGVDYAAQQCAVARTLEVVGGRWTMLIVRDCFFGVRRFSDLREHLGVSRAVLSERLAQLVDDGVLARVPSGGREAYDLTPKGLALWPVLVALLAWGDEHASPGGARRLFSHAACGTDLDRAGGCPACGLAPPPHDVVMRPGPGSTGPQGPGRVSAALQQPRRLLDPV
ncbi:hypothetical protein GCM10009737_01650 [Nocardioides lentus]|uniref:HTH hxlR-type domain-containing protein n=1 Tax=Nocardioides lentus TaxID=338077 RepID=A0ABP5A901_9ACTN